MNSLLAPSDENTVKKPDAYPTFAVGDTAVRKSDGCAFTVRHVEGDLIGGESVESYPKRGGFLVVQHVHRKHFKRVDGDAPGIDDAAPDDPLHRAALDAEASRIQADAALTKVYQLLDEQKQINQKLQDALAFERGLNATRRLAQPGYEALRVNNITSDAFAARLNDGWRVTLWNWEGERLDVMFVREAAAPGARMSQSAPAEVEASLAGDLFSSRRAKLEQMAHEIGLPVSWTRQQNSFTRQAWEGLRHTGLR